VRHRAPPGPRGLARLHGPPAPGAQRLLLRSAIRIVRRRLLSCISGAACST
jgi:hypothetical protein